MGFLKALKQNEGGFGLSQNSNLPSSGQCTDDSGINLVVGRESDFPKEKKSKEHINELETLVANIGRFSEEFERQHIKLKGLLCLDNLRLTYFKRAVDFYEALRNLELEEKRHFKNIRRIKTLSKDISYGTDRFIVEIPSPTGRRRKNKNLDKKDSNNDESWMGSASATEDGGLDRKNSLDFVRDLLLNFGHGMVKPEEDIAHFHQFQFYVRKNHIYINISKKKMAF